MYQGRFEKPRQERLANPETEVTTSRRPAAPAPQSRPAAPTQEPAAAKQPAKKKTKKRSRTGSVIFYTLYCLMIAVFFVAMFGLLDWLHGWLMDYEAAQPNAKCEAVFEELFADPDWEQVYTLSGMEDGIFDGKAAYAAYMEEKVGETELTYMETAAGLSGDKKYFVKLGDEKIASFTLTRTVTNLTDIPDWTLGEVTIMFQRSEDVRIQKMSGQTAYINGIALDDSYTVKMTSTVAEDYLPNGMQGIRTDVQYVSGLLMEPTVTVKDAKGNELTVNYDAETDTYVVASEAMPDTVPDDINKVIINAAENYCKFMIEAPNSLSKCFDKESKIYKTLTDPNFALWMQDYIEFEFVNETVTDYCRYSDDLFSAHVSLSLNVTRKDSSVKEYTLDTTFFFEDQGGTYKVIEMTNVDVQEERSEVRLTFMNGEDELSSAFFDANAHTLETPVITAPEGKVFDGWYKEEIGADGKKTLSLVFTPDAQGVVKLSGELEPLTLYALFVDADEASVSVDSGEEVNE